MSKNKRKDLRSFKVRCSLENVFYAFIDAHDADEAEALAAKWCRKYDNNRDDGLFWEMEAAHKHYKFEAEETD